MKNFEQIGAFYLGRPIERETGEIAPEPLLYDSKDLTTHAVIVGMTGSGKTGLGIGLLEEAAIDGVPVIAIDPKGDMGNLLLTFPRLRPADFSPWIDASEAARRGRTPDEEARATAELWRKGLADWGQEPSRIERFAESAERVIYTPGGTSGRQLCVLRSLSAPSAALLADAEALRDRVSGAVSGLLGLLGVDADPIRSRETILLSTLVERAWRAGQDLDLPTLIRQVQKPPIERVGVMDLDSFFPSDDRFELAMMLNNLVASPGFAAWTEGEPLDVAKLMWADDGRPRISVLSIAHLSDRERMFFVTLLLSEILAWMRTQPGSRTLRAILYMDEVFGYFPPTANPPSKTPMLTLLKQGRAFGLGVVLATQNPVDLDYKGLSNAGTWFVGRLQTERDKARLIDGLEGAAAGAKQGFDRATLERTISGLESRVFLMNNVHEDEPVLFHTRWALSYLAGPLARDQIRALSGGALAPPAASPASPISAPAASAPAASAKTETARFTPQDLVLPADRRQGFLPVTQAIAAGEHLVYRPALLGTARLHYANRSTKLDDWEQASWLTPLEDSGTGTPWELGGELHHGPPDLEPEPDDGAQFAEPTTKVQRAPSWTRWSKQLATHAYRSRPKIIWKCAKPRLVGALGEEKGAFRGRVREAMREERDLKLEKLRRRYAPKLSRVREQIQRAEQKVDIERAQYGERKLQTAVSIGRTVLGALFGRKLGSASNVSRAGTAIDRAARTARERGDISRAEERLETLRVRLEDLEAQFEEDVAPLQEAISPDEVDVENVKVAPRKADLDVETLTLVWVPWRVDATGTARAAHSL